MADGFSCDIDTSAVSAAFSRLGDTALKYTKPASKISADSMQREMQSRVARATGKTADNILVTELDDGYVVATADVRLDRTPIPGTAALRSEYYPEKHVGLWLEKGTSLGAPHSHAAAARPWFFPSIALEEGPHERRIKDAVEQAITDEGLGV